MVRATNPLRSEESVLRTAILPGLLRAVATNRSQGLADVALFELGRVFLAPTGAGPLPEEPEHVALAWAGSIRRRPVEDDRAVDVYDAVDALHAVADALGIADVTLESAPVRGLRNGRAARLVVGGVEAGTVGEVTADVLGALGLDAPVVVAEIALGALFAAPRRDRTFRAPSKYPASLLDLAFAVDDGVSASAIMRTLRSAGGDVLEDVRCFDVFHRDALGPARRSLAFTVRFRAPDHTLSDQEAAELRQRCIDAVTAEHGAELRG